MSFTHKPSHNVVEVNFTPETGVAVGTSRRSLKSFPPFGDTIVITPTRKDKALSLPLPKGRGIPRRFDEEVLTAALKLTPREQIRLIQVLLQSLAQVLQDKDMPSTSENGDETL